MLYEILFWLLFVGILLTLICLLIVCIWLLTKSYRASLQRAHTQLGLPPFQELRVLVKDEPGQRPFWQDVCIPTLSFLAGVIPLYLMESQLWNDGASVSWSDFLPGGIIAWSFLGWIGIGTKLRDSFRIRGQTVCMMGSRPYEGRAIEQVTGGILFLCLSVFFGFDVFRFRLGNPLVALMLCIVLGTFGFYFIARAPADRLTQLGFFSKGNLYPWRIILCYRWTENRKALIIVHDVRLYFQGIFFLTVMPEDCDLVERWLREKLPDAERPPYRHPLLVEAAELESNASQSIEQS